MYFLFLVFIWKIKGIDTDKKTKINANVRSSDSPF